MKVSHRELEECRRNPRQWLAARANPPAGRAFGYNQALLYAIHRFHRKGAQAARAHLNHLIDEHLRNLARIEQIRDALEGYIDWINRNDVIIADSKVRVALSVTGFLDLSGEISRLDVTGGGYRAVILGSSSRGWEKELRMPLIQQAIALKYGRPPGEIEVAVQDLDGSGLRSKSFSKADLKMARDAFRELGEQIRRLRG